MSKDPSHHKGTSLCVWTWVDPSSYLENLVHWHILSLQNRNFDKTLFKSVCSLPANTLHLQHQNIGIYRPISSSFLYIHCLETELTETSTHLNPSLAFLSGLADLTLIFSPPSQSSTLTFLYDTVYPYLHRLCLLLKLQWTVTLRSPSCNNYFE